MTHSPALRGQRGIGTLAVTMLLLFAISVVSVYLNRGILFEQRTSGNQARATLAMEVAEAGIEWATGMLNSPHDISTSCGFLSTSNLSFRRRYVQTKVTDPSNPTTAVVPRTDIFPGCKITSTGMTCNCPTAAGSASLGSAVQPSFTVAFEAVAADPESVRITAWGCAAQDATCTAAASTSADANARVSVILKLRPLLRAVPAAPLTCGTSCALSGAYNVVNTDVATNGILVNAGTTISTNPSVNLDTLPGLPGENALVGSDPSLASLSSSDTTCTNSNMFNSYFGSTLAQYAASPNTKTLSCTSGADCVSKVNTAYSEGWRNFFFTSDVQLSGGGTLGSSLEPVTLVTASALRINGTWNVYGLLFSNNADWNNTGTGTVNLYGAQVSCADYNNNGNGTITYDPNVLKRVRDTTARMVRVPGSWRDYRLNTDLLP